tara:strand:- start:404 stop:658 length:255 start_codon:yes stop_codon:yes gene_type:complete
MRYKVKDLKSGSFVRLRSSNEELLAKHNKPVEYVKLVKSNPPTVQLKKIRNKANPNAWTIYAKDVLDLCTAPPSEVDGREVVVV